MALVHVEQDSSVQCVTNVSRDTVAQIVTNVPKGTTRLKDPASWMTVGASASLVNVAAEGLKRKMMMEPVDANQALVEVHVIIVDLGITCTMMNV